MSSSGPVSLIAVLCFQPSCQDYLSASGDLAGTRYIVNNGGGIKVSKRPNCNYQIQGQLLLSGLEFCDFILYTRKDLYTEKV